MKYVGVKELSRHLSEYLSEKEWVIITKNGKPAKVIIDVDEESLEDLILAHHLDLDKEYGKALSELDSEKTTSLDDYLRGRKVKAS